VVPNTTWLGLAALYAVHVRCEAPGNTLPVLLAFLLLLISCWQHLIVDRIARGCSVMSLDL
jgi:hypothetical protein